MTARYPAHDLRFPSHPQLEEQPLTEVTVATLVINGELDTPRRREMGDELARALPRAERTIVPGAGHLPNLDNPAQYNERILSFIERSTGDGRSGGRDA
jgi:pimeloyl-ACP methyl ester carboxylesterase